MGDNKLLTELADSFLNGIRTTNKEILNTLYREKDDQFPEQDDLSGRILPAFNTFRHWEDLPTQAHRQIMARCRLLP
jgi:hypothetical protein